MTKISRTKKLVVALFVFQSLMIAFSSIYSPEGEEGLVLSLSGYGSVFGEWERQVLLILTSLASFVSYLGLLMDKKWARTVLLLSFILGWFLVLLGGLTVSTGVGSALGYATSIVEGALLWSLFFTKEKIE